jgi:hypothetical protein
MLAMTVVIVRHEKETNMKRGGPCTLFLSGTYRVSTRHASSYPSTRSLLYPDIVVNLLEYAQILQVYEKGQSEGLSS